MDEFELIRRFFVRDTEADDIVLGIGDDGAVLKPPADREQVVVIDTLVENVHFPGCSEPRDAGRLGYRAVAVNLSDIAAMGAVPRWMTLALTLDRSDPTWLSGFSTGLMAAADEHDVQLVGGDTTRGNAIVVRVHLTGFVEPGTALRRDGAKSGDTVYLSGTVGDGAAGLELMTKPLDAYHTEQQFLTERFWKPQARVQLGRALRNRATAAIDVSDGLLGDLGKLVEASGVGATIRVEDVPLSQALTTCFDEDRVLPLALTGGDDYELCFAAPAGLPEEIAGVPVTPIGTINSEPGVRCLLNDEPAQFEHQGYVHFQ